MFGLSSLLIFAQVLLGEPSLTALFKTTNLIPPPAFLLHDNGLAILVRNVSYLHWHNETDFFFFTSATPVPGKEPGTS